MKCFYHRELDAVGLCKVCHKGVCENCAVEVDQSIACKGRCETQVAALDAIVAKSMVTMNAQQKNRMFMPAFFLVMGVVIVITGFIRGGGFGTSLLMGGVFFAFGIALILVNRKWVKDMEAK